MEGEGPSFSWQKSESMEIHSNKPPGRLLTEEQWDLVWNSSAFGKREFPLLEDIKQ